MNKRLLVAAFVLCAPAAQAIEYQPAMQSFLDGQILPWAQDAVLVQAITAQNLAHAGLDAARIDAMDQTWRAEVGSGHTPTIDAVLMNAAADFLRARVAETGGRITEVFIMDNHGLNVAASDVTSDYWQGDEDKFQKTYDLGAGAVHFSEVEFDESSQTYQAQISITLTDPATGQPIGAMTVGIDAESLM